MDKPDSIVGEEVLARHFPAGVGQPVMVIGNAAAGRASCAVPLGGTPGIVAVSQPVERNGLVYLEGTLADAPDSRPRRGRPSNRPGRRARGAGRGRQGRRHDGGQRWTTSRPPPTTTR